MKNALNDPETWSPLGLVPPARTVLSPRSAWKSDPAQHVMIPLGSVTALGGRRCGCMETGKGAEQVSRREAVLAWTVLEKGKGGGVGGEFWW